ncbi:hypothetical protein AWW66_17555 [Micromonospora rosaria]|uniref:ABC transporter permease n=1 Tax=Micromonospora rosaria TaxID=47874 RepID=A0A136PQD6_9ACTN|nr:ABC transporter permease subunit [Micromonospora rosaria]KXK60685.1 hypothetical protein AWW66_17555 [Micromonospora rosaria]
MSLYRTELRRLVKRRFTRYMTLLGLLVLALVVAGLFATNEKVGPEQWAAAERQADRQHQEQVRWAERERAGCERDRAAGVTDDGRYPTDCAEIVPPPRDQIEAEWFLPATFDFRQGFEDLALAFTAVLALVAFVVGASFVGAEWSTGGMMNLLLWRPRRVTVLLTKLAALLTGLIAVTVSAGALWTAGLWLTAVLRGSTERMTPGVWESFALTGLRGLALVLAVAVVGFGLASLGRHTAMALGGAIALAVVGQFGVGILFSMANVAFVERWLMPTYALAWMQQKVTLQEWRSCVSDFSGQCQPATYDVTWGQSAVLFGAGVVLVLGAAIWAMRRRDIS